MLLILHGHDYFYAQSLTKHPKTKPSPRHYSVPHGAAEGKALISLMSHEQPDPSIKTRPVTIFSKQLGQY